MKFSEELESTIAEELAGEQDGVQPRLEALRSCLSKLRTTDRDLLLHRYSAIGTLSELAHRVGRSADGLKVTLHRLRNALLRCIELQLRQSEVQP